MAKTSQDIYLNLAEYLTLSLVAILLINHWWLGDYRLADSKARDKTYRPDFQIGPIIGPLPAQLKYGSQMLKLHEWGIRYEVTNKMVNDIIDIYNDVTFGKEYQKRCNKLRKDGQSFTNNGMSLVNVQIKFSESNGAAGKVLITILSNLIS